MFKKFIKYYGPHKVIFALDMGASLLVSMIAVVYPIVTRTMLNHLIPQREYKLMFAASLFLLGMYFIRMMLRYFIQYKGHMMGVYMQAHMRRDLFSHLESLPYSFYDTHETGKLMTRITNDLKDVSELAHHGPENIIISTVSMLTACSYLATINGTLTLIIFACAPILCIISYKLKSRMHRAFAMSNEALANINGSLESSISGIRVTKAFNNADKEKEKFERGNKEFLTARRDGYKAMGQFHSTTAFIIDIFNVIVLLVGGLFLYQGKINFGDYSAFVVSINIFIVPLNSLIMFMEQFQDGMAGFERFVQIMSASPEEDAPDAIDVGRLTGDIDFDHVSSQYEEDKEILRDINLHIPAGSTVALVGPSGGGKTSICHLLPRFYEVANGSISIDGRDITTMTRASLRDNIGIVQQDIYLFNASIRENILYGKLEATDNEIIAAAKAANIHDYIMTLPAGYETVIGERGVRLSGGQKQRISIARVFLKNPPILILDEATSALDNTSEIQIQRALDDLGKGRTTIVVAHRLSTIKNANHIVVIENGSIVEQGTHSELMTQNGIYAELYNLQYRT